MLHGRAEVPEASRRLLRRWWKLVDVDDVQAAKELYSSDGCYQTYARVFIKLRSRMLLARGVECWSSIRLRVIGRESLSSARIAKY